jgi:hypothetical protein
MAKKGFSKPVRNRGEDIGEPNGMTYNYKKDQANQERTVNRHEIRDRYQEMFRNEQRRDQRAFQRVMDPFNEFYAGIDPRRKKEVADAGMIQEDHRQVANLSDRFIHCEFPKAPYYHSQYLADTINGFDQMRDDDEFPF